MEHKFYIRELYVRQHEGCRNAVARVEWVCVLKRGGAKVMAAGRTDLGAPDPSAFTSIGSLDAQQVLDWVVEKEGGQEWVNRLIAAHEGAMSQAEADLTLEPWHIPLINPQRFDPNNV